MSNKMEIKLLSASPLILSVPAGQTITNLVNKVPQGYVGYVNGAGWEFLNGQAQQDLRVKLLCQDEVILQSARQTNAAGTLPPFSQVAFDQPTSTNLSTQGRETSTVSSAAGAAYFSDNNAPSESFPILKPIREETDITWVITNQSSVYTHYVICYLSGYFYASSDPKEREYPGNLNLPDPVCQREVTILGNTETIAIAGSVTSAGIAIVGTPHLRGLVYTATQNVSVTINQGVHDFGAINYRNAQTVIVPGGTSALFDTFLNGRFVSITITNLSGAATTAVEYWFAVRGKR